ncbi:MAG TPA: hypothetical protein VHO69_06255 [Phototrophicaceae bacterium]|nr:hypothetical protein [Phototrophicaceae bacterium]
MDSIDGRRIRKVYITRKHETPPTNDNTEAAGGEARLQPQPMPSD